MLDFGFIELILIIAVAVLVIGPQDIPKLMAHLGRAVRRLQYIRYAFTQQFDEFLKQNDLDDLRNSVNYEAQRRGDDFDEEAADDEAGSLMKEPHDVEADDDAKP